MENNAPITSATEGTSNAITGITGHGPTMRVSRLSVPVLAAAFLIGIASGAIGYAHRSPVLEQHVAGTNAITVHVVLAVAAAAVVIAIQVWRLRKQGGRGPSPWSAPFSAHAMERIIWTIRFSRGASVARIVPMAALTVFLLFVPFRIGSQFIGRLDPNSNINAWGGPSYAGALLAHSLDLVIGFYIAAFLLGRLLTGRDGSRKDIP